MRNRFVPVLALLFSLNCSTAAFAITQPFDHSLWDQFLKKFVSENGGVDYGAAQKDPAFLNQYLEKIAVIDPEDFNENWPREEKMAVLINAYHAALIKKILEYYPVTSVQKIPDFWQMDIAKLAGRTLGLNEIRDMSLAKEYRDEKLQTALSYGALSGPRLSRDAFTGEKLEGQLFLAARNFVNDSELNQIIPGQKTIYLNRIFDWHSKEFVLDFGTPENETGIPNLQFAILSFVSHYLGDLEKIRFLEEGKYKVKYLRFDWTLNDWKPGTGTSQASAN